MSQQRVVAVGLLTQADLDLLGRNFTRHFPLDRSDVFADLLAELDKVEAVSQAGQEEADAPRR